MITKEPPHYWSDMANLTHATQVSTFGWCSCEDNEGNPNPYDDCPDSWEHDECQCGNLGWVNGEGKCSECETTP